MMWDAAAAKTRAQGGEIHMDHTMQSLAYDAEAKDLDDRGANR